MTDFWRARIPDGPVAGRPAGTGKQPTETEYAQRLRDAEALLVALGSPRKAAAALVERYAKDGVCKRTAMNWCRTVRERWVEEQAERDGESRLERVARLRAVGQQILEMSLADRNTKSAQAVWINLCAIDGVALNKIELTGKDGGPVQVETMTREERQARIAELQARAAASTVTDPGGGG